MQERLQKFIASATSYSRRKAEKLIAAGKVTVNHVVVTELGTKIDPTADNVSVHGKTLKPVQAFRYVLVNKPVGYVCTRAQHKGERTVYDLVPHSEALVIAGRLDKDSEGLVLLTDDGALVNQLTHPRFVHKKEYEVTLRRSLHAEDLALLRAGIRLQEGIAKADHSELVSPTVIRLVLHQGWKRQIRRMFETIHHEIIRLQRIRLGRVQLGNLQPGGYRLIRRDDIL